MSADISAGQDEATLSPILQVRNLAIGVRTPQGYARPVDGVSFDLFPGEILGIVGESGSGKSLTSLSLMRLLTKNLAITAQSSIQLEGTELNNLTEKEMVKLRGKDIAMIFQEPMTSLNPMQRIGNQIAEVFKLHTNYPKKQRDDEVISLLKLVGIPSPEQRAKEYPHQLSGGMRQRVMIAMALACKPKVLLADEPTTALDVTIQAQVLDLLHELTAKIGMATVLVSHDMGVIARTCKRIAVMYAGRIIEVGETDKVLANPRHPYSRALLASIPEIGMDRNIRVPSIPGSAPKSPWPEGCRFAARCEFATEQCTESYPAMFETESGEAACWLLDEEQADANVMVVNA